MYILACDTCKKKITEETKITAGYGNRLLGHAFCEKCGAPVLQFLKKNGFIKKQTTDKV